METKRLRKERLTFRLPWRAEAYENACEAIRAWSQTLEAYVGTPTERRLFLLLDPVDP